ncbi:transmembrane protein 97-like [Senna tora]|uniref:Transmembrane protein 97-like n=1 Tax=Senna tora TaxID=362788 RepID=A0A834WKY5_9FABA|nr:transmembrane protein 97-like [Senna tora]
MGCCVKLIDAILLLYFVVIALVVPLIDGQTCLPQHYFPDMVVNLRTWYSHEYEDYLMLEKPHFFGGLAWLELLFQWPIALANLYAILAGKPWFNTTCLIYGVSVSASMAGVLGELMGSERASEKLLMVYFSWMVFGVIAILRGLMPTCVSTCSSTAKKVARKKRA